MKFEPAKMLVSFTATLLRWKFQPAEMHGHSSKAVISTCRNIISYTATLPRLSFQSAEMLVSCTATLPRFFSAVITTCQNIVSYTATLPRFFLAVITTCQNVGQLHSHSPLAHHPTVSRLVVTWTCPVGQLVITWTFPVGQPITPSIPLSANWSLLELAMSAAPLAHQPHSWPTGSHLNLTVSQPITSTIVMWLAMSAEPLLMPIMSCPLTSQPW